MRASLAAPLGTGTLLAALLLVDASVGARSDPLGLGPPVDVTLTGAGGVVGAEGPWLLFGRRGIVAAGTGPLRLELASRSGRLVANGVDLGPERLRLETLDGVLRAADRAYRGALLLEARGRTVRVRNRLPLEDYVASVVGAELPRRFHRAALEAQAVATRTYALATLARGRPLLDDARSQVYGGLATESAASRAAALTTRGVVLETEEGGLFPTYFHSTCGGHTSTPADVFGSPGHIPPLRGVPDADCSISPHARWRRRATHDDLARLVGGADRPLRLLVTRRDRGGRVLACELRDPEGRLVDRLRGEDLRVRLRTARGPIPSCLFRESPVAGGYVLDGAGLGHGVGLCQWGAEGMARRGKTWREILRRYYPGARLRERRDY